MPIITKCELPVNEILRKENIQILEKGEGKDTLQIAILNLMPNKEETELQLLRELSNTDKEIKITLLNVATYQSTHTNPEHLKKFYTTFDEIKNQQFDGLIITGAPVEQMEFEKVDYWEELKEIMKWSETNVRSTLHICWGAQSGLYYHYGIPKHLINHKMFGIFEHQILDKNTQILKGLQQDFKAPHSRHTGIDRRDVVRNPELTIVAESKEAGVFIVENKKNHEIYITGHLEYDADTLDHEYKRDLSKGLDIQEPKNYYKNGVPEFSWKENGIKFYSNWVNEYVAK